MGVWRLLGGRVLPVFANTLTMLFKRFGGLTSWIFSTMVPIFHSLWGRT